VARIRLGNYPTPLTRCTFIFKIKQDVRTANWSLSPTWPPRSDQIYIYIYIDVCFQNYVTVKDYLFTFFFFYYITAQIIYLNWATLASSDQISLKTWASYNNIRLWPFLPILNDWYYIIIKQRTHNNYYMGKRGCKYKL
jgi:hypothetical protein